MRALDLAVQPRCGGLDVGMADAPVQNVPVKAREAAVSTMSENLVTIALQSSKEVLTLIGLDGDSAELENIDGKLFEVLALVDRVESDHFARLSIRADGRCPVGRIARSNHFDIGAMLLRSDPFPTS